MLLEKGKSFFFSFLSLFFFFEKSGTIHTTCFQYILTFWIVYLVYAIFFSIGWQWIIRSHELYFETGTTSIFFVNKSELIFLFLAGSNPLTHNLRSCIIGSAYGKCTSLSYANLFAFLLPNFLFLLTDHSYSDLGIETKVLHNLSCAVGLEFCKY